MRSRPSQPMFVAKMGWNISKGLLQEHRKHHQLQIQLLCPGIDRWLRIV
ncbi:hypothetical protein HanIR_Chr17g0887791 [Helianthus annuus]|nr:hypothetical protein HanIR_Chr17g0887791 [Helianthus annuus]